MGTWSRPLFVTVGVGAPENYIIDISLMSPQELARWRHAAFMDRTEDASKTCWNLTEFMNTHCDTHKIIDHMDREQILRWEGLFRGLYSLYPALTNLAFHFFCRDGQFPYFLTMDRGDEAKLTMCVGHSESYVYFQPRRPRGCFGWLTRDEDEEAAEFMPEWYRRAYLEGRLDMRHVRLDASRILW
jgi:hypothetical protein